VTLAKLTHLQRLEAESIHIFREVIAASDKPVMLYSVGKEAAEQIFEHLERNGVLSRV
jgi:sulfate adenylyltransferase subunit 2